MKPQLEHELESWGRDGPDDPQPPDSFLVAVRAAAKRRRRTHASAAIVLIVTAVGFAWLNPRAPRNPSTPGRTTIIAEVPDSRCDSSAASLMRDFRRSGAAELSLPNCGSVAWVRTLPAL